VQTTPIIAGEQQSVFIFAFVLAKINVLCFGIAKMLLKKAMWEGDCSVFVCFGCRVACGANKMAEMCDRFISVASTERGEESKNLKNCLLRSNVEKLSTQMLPLVLPLYLCPSLWRITTNGWQAGAGGFLKNPLSTRTNVCLKIQMFFSGGKH
jgi:hypothetical protein